MESCAAKIRVYTGTDGKCKGDALVTFANAASVELAVPLAESTCRGKNIKKRLLKRLSRNQSKSIEINRNSSISSFFTYFRICFKDLDLVSNGLRTMFLGSVDLKGEVPPRV